MGKQRKGEIFAAVIIVLVLVMITSYNRGHSHGRSEGIVAGANWALDTVNTLLHEQVRNDSTVMKLTLVKPDTCSYIISSRDVWKLKE